MHRPHALVVGGTGMLREAVLGLANDHEVTLLARGEDRLRTVARKSSSIHPVAADYGDAAALAAALDAAVAARGPFALALAWIHSDAPEAPLAVAGRVRGAFFHVLPCEAAGPGAAPRPIPGVQYHEVILGWVHEGGSSRWLTHREISRGALEAIADPRPRRIVGTVEPWSARP